MNTTFFLKYNINCIVQNIFVFVRASLCKTRYQRIRNGSQTAAFKELMSYFGRLYILYLIESVVTSKRNWELRKLISLEACDKTDRKVYSLGGVFFVWGLFCFQFPIYLSAPAVNIFWLTLLSFLIAYSVLSFELLTEKILQSRIFDQCLQLTLE